MTSRILLLGLLAAWPAAAQQTFGTAGEVPFALHGRVYAIPENTEALPDFTALTPIGTLSTNVLNVETQSFEHGFPGITDRFEWFAIEYQGAFLIRDAGHYVFRLTSDDGSRLFIDDQKVIESDGIHGANAVTGEADLAEGVHTVRVQYFQGPRYEIALQLDWGRTEEDLQPMNFAELAPASFREEGNRLIAELAGAVLFASGSAELRPDAIAVLRELKRGMVDAVPNGAISIVGHTDDVGSDSDNQSLSERRAAAVVTWLVGQGVPAARIHSEGRGESSPVVPNTSDANRARNRRIEFIVTRP
jgi:outer membrane protein OmpA-like peptidoglycan-associated protein